MEQTTIAVTAVSSRSVFVATTAPDAFRLGNLEVCMPGPTCVLSVPSALGTVAFPAPSMTDTREVAVDLIGDPASGRLTLGLARASRTEIQATRVDLCFLPD